ncbi:hypothetical protein BH23ACT12_BH23ACT12_19440 [soil metagenome]
MNEEERFQAYLMSKDPQGRPAWAPDPDVYVKPKFADSPMAHFIKAFLHIGDHPY